jgi:hypothetical protein
MLKYFFEGLFFFESHLMYDQTQGSGSNAGVGGWGKEPVKNNKLGQLDLLQIPR